MRERGKGEGRERDPCGANLFLSSVTQSIHSQHRKNTQ
jgi:hypothetical protein